MSSHRDPSTIDPSLYFQAPSVSQPTALRTANSHVKLIYDHEDFTSKRVLHFLRDNGIEPDLIHYRYSPLSRRELTGLLKSIPKRDLEFFVKLSSQRYKQQPFTISQQYHEQTINSILPYQGDLLGVPIVYNTLSNTAAVVPPFTTSQDPASNPFNLPNAVLPSSGNTTAKDVAKNEHAKQQAVLQNLLQVITPEVGQNKLWDGGGDLFPVPSRLERTRSLQRDWEVQRWEKEQELIKKKEIDKVLTNRKLNPWEKEQQVNTIIDQQAEKLKSMFDEQSNIKVSRFSPSYEKDKAAYDTNISNQKRIKQIQYDPVTGKPTPGTLGFGDGGGLADLDPSQFDSEDDFLAAVFEYPGDQIRVQLPDATPRDLDFASKGPKHQRYEDIYTSREQWRRKQEKSLANVMLMNLKPGDVNVLIRSPVRERLDFVVES